MPDHHHYKSRHPAEIPVALPDPGLQRQLAEPQCGMKIVLVTNIPAPYRIPVYNLVARELGDDFHVVFCARIEHNRQWDLGLFEFKHTFLNENFYLTDGAAVHSNLDVVGVLHRYHPQVVITTGFGPTHLYSWGYALATGSKHIPMTDAWLYSEMHLGISHRVVRRMVYRTSSAFLGASQKSLQLYKSYGVAGSGLFQSCLCIDNKRFFSSAVNTDRPYDLMYAGQIIEGKIPSLFTDVVRIVKQTRGMVRVLVIGDGVLRHTFLESLADAGADYEYAGFVSQAELPRHYSRAKLLLFTTARDAWGIVANEALASGTPVFTTPYAGVAHELVVDGWNGFVLEPDPQLWGEKVVAVLEDPGMLVEMRANAVRSVNEYTFEKAASGIVAAAKWAYRHKGFSAVIGRN